MSTIYMTEQEQIEAIKKWFMRYHKYITWGILIILSCVLGYKYWTWHYGKVMQQASNAYEHLMVAYSNQDRQNIHSYANQLIQEYDDTIYANGARLTLAKLLVTENDYATAKSHLQYVADNAKMSALQQIAKIRLARVFIQEKLYDQALETLKSIPTSSYTPLVAELKGDIYAKQGQHPQAVLAYQQAVNVGHNLGVNNIFLEMKLNAVKP